jgi:hypothetical protein
MPKNLLASASFAHLLGRPAAAKRAEEDEKEREDKAKRAKSSEDDGEEDDDKKPSDDKDARAEEEDGEEDEPQAKKKARRASDDEDDEDEGDAKALAARGRERARCAAIFASPHAAARPDVAAHLAFGTTLSRREALNVLAAVGSNESRTARKGNLAARMDQQTNPNVGTPPEAHFGAPAASDPSALAARMLASARKARGE